MKPQTIERRVERLEERVTRLEELPHRIDELTGQILQLRAENGSELSAFQAMGAARFCGCAPSTQRSRWLTSLVNRARVNAWAAAIRVSAAPLPS